MFALVLLIALQTPAPSSPPTTPEEPAPAALATEATPPLPPTTAPPTAPPATTPTPPATTRPRLVRVVVQDVVVADGDLRLQRIFTASLVTEVRKIDGVSVVGMDEVRALLDQAANAQMAGCSEEGCLAELGDALGANIVVTASLSRLADDSLVSFRRLDVSTATPTGVDRRFARGDGTEFLAVIGPAVAELFPERPLRAGVVRGVDQEAALLLNPPPLPPWLFWTTSVAASASLLTGAGAGVVSRLFTDSAQRRTDDSVSGAVAAIDVKRDFDTASQSAVVANSFFVAGAALAVGSVGVWFFTDFAGRADAEP